MHLTPFLDLLPEVAHAETRWFVTRGSASLPADEYALIEAYCTDPACDCRRVMLNVIGRHQGPRYLASISFGFDREAEDAGPYLDPLNPQSRHAGALLNLVEASILSDAAYVDRLERHYEQVKAATADPTHPVQSILSRPRSPLPPMPPRPAKKRRKR